MLKPVETLSLKLSIKTAVVLSFLSATALAPLVHAEVNGPTVVADPVTAALMDATLRKSEVANAIHAGASSGNAASTPSNRPMIQVVRPATEAGQSHLMLATIFDGSSDASAPQLQRRAGIDLRAGAPMGVGVEFHYTIIAPVRVGVALDTTLATYAVTAEATVSILPIFIESRWTPTVTVAFSHVQFTGMSDSIMKKYNPYLDQQGVDIHTSGMGLNALTVMGGIDYIAEGGFHFNVSAGRLWQIGKASSNDDNPAVLSGISSLVVQIAVGYQF